MSDIPLDPINRQASKVFDKGEQVELRTSQNYVCSKEPIPILTDEHLIAQFSVNITGVTRGRLTVIGKALDVKARWVVRCSCGNYELRRSKVMTQEFLPESAARCAECQIQLIGKSFFKRDKNTLLIEDITNGN